MCVWVVKNMFGLEWLLVRILRDILSSEFVDFGQFFEIVSSSAGDYARAAPSSLMIPLKIPTHASLDNICQNFHPNNTNHLE